MGYRKKYTGKGVCKDRGIDRSTVEHPDQKENHRRAERRRQPPLAS